MPPSHITLHNWNAHKETIIDLYIQQDVSLDDLVKHMKSRGFKASRGQYDRQLKKWNVFKNLQEKQWKLVIRTIKDRRAVLRSSEVFFHGRRLPSSRVRKAIQRYDPPKLYQSLSPGPPPELMEDIRVCTPPRSPQLGAMTLSPIIGPLRNDNVVPLICRPQRTIVIDHLAFIAVRRKLQMLCTASVPTSMQLLDVSSLDSILPVIACHLSPSRGNSRLFQSLYTDGHKRQELWRELPMRVADFPIPLSQPLANRPFELCLWFIEFLAVASTNGLLHDYVDPSLQWVAYSLDTGNSLDKLFEIIREYNLYEFLERILDLDTPTTQQFAAQALLSSVELEDERLLDILLERKVALDAFRKPQNRDEYVSAIHLAVQQQNLKIIQRLLEAGIDPDGYVREEYHAVPGWPTLRPLSRLLQLFSLKHETHIVRISSDVVSSILEYRWKRYGAEHCGLYLGMLYVRAWTADATDCLAPIRYHCHQLRTRSDDRSNADLLRTIAYQEDGKAIVNIIENNLLGTQDSRVTRGLSIANILRKALDERLEPLVYAIIEQNPTILMDMNLKSHTIEWLVETRINVSDYCYQFFLSAIEDENLRLCKILVHLHSTQSTPSKNSKDLQWPTDHWILEPALKASKDFAEDLILYFADRSFFSWASILEMTFQHASVALCKLIAKSCVSSITESEQLQIFQSLLNRTIHGKYSIAKWKFIMECFGYKNWPIDWSTFYSIKETETSRYMGDTLLLQELTSSGLPITKTLFIACTLGTHYSETVPFLLKDNPGLVSELSHEDVSNIFTHRTVATSFTEGYRLLYLWNMLQSCGLMVDHRWLAYCSARRDKLEDILEDGWPCVDCKLHNKCMKPVLAAVDRGNKDLLKVLIADGFDVGTAPVVPLACSAARPLLHAIDYGMSDFVDILIQAGADLDVLGYRDCAPARTALQVACLRGHFVIACKLLEAGADINGAGAINYGNTALELAALTGRLDIVHLLVENNSDRKKLKHDCKRAGIFAWIRHHKFIAEFLLRKAEALEREIGSDEIDEWMKDLCVCELYRVPFASLGDCCRDAYPTVEKWYASLLYFTNGMLEPDLDAEWSFPRNLTGSESIEEIERLIVCREPSEYESSSLGSRESKTLRFFEGPD